jgi:hypothetical protein
VRFMVCFTLAQLVIGGLINQRSGGAEKWRPSVGKVREWYVESRHLQGCVG